MSLYIFYKNSPLTYDSSFTHHIFLVVYYTVVYGWTASTTILCYFFFVIIGLYFAYYDLIVNSFPRRLALTLLVLIVLVTLWNIFTNTFFITNCNEILLPWGIFGEKISHCAIKRLIYQTITSLMVSAAITLLKGGTDNLLFCNVNIYRSTGTVDCHIQNAVYVSSMCGERERSTTRNIKAKSSNIELELK